MTLYTRGRAWTYADDDALTEMYEGRDAKHVLDIAKALNRTERAVDSRISALGLLRDPDWLEEKGKRDLAQKTRAAIAKQMPQATGEWPADAPHFQDEPRIAARWKRAVPKPMPIPTPDRTMAGVVSMD